MEISSSTNIQGAQVSIMSGNTSSVPLLARAYLRLGIWQWALSPGLDDDSIQGMYAYS